MTDRIQLMVKAKLITQEQADEAKSRLIEEGVTTSKPSSAP
jgi:membrane peptidoglycan carboxypeptidase